MDDFNLNKANRELKVSNEFNAIPLRNFTATELDLLTTIMTQMRDKELEHISFDFSDLKELSKYNKETAIKSFADDLDSTYDKLTSLKVRIGNEVEWTKFVLFTEYTINVETQKITIGTNPRFKHLINNYLELGYTQVELEEFVNLKSSYSKNLYRLLKQYRLSGKAFFNLENFRDLMDIPKSYKYGNIKQQVLKVAIKELTPLFKNLTIKEIKGRGKDKRKIVKLEFYFAPEKSEEYKIDKYNKKPKKLSDTDNRMTKQERIDFVKRKQAEFKRLYGSENEEIKNVEGQIDLEDL